MSKIISLRIDEKVLEKIDKIAKQENRSRNNFIETTLIKEINKSKEKVDVLTVE